ncbi:HNH endonuclease signature motif containing protein [Zhihengliuella halotolerans]|uniref:HNH endonuclease signature motif containing protein n=1 Tax=Zhihengliuella halotolerans TaxID=370736 RepID=UPI000C7F9010|nr:HNH endonuclease signature motif containing protein [Zhihengliuella halotolerans]
MAITHPFESSASPAGATDRLRAAAALLAGLGDEVGSSTDEDLLEQTRATEELGRLVDALRVRNAGEVEARSSKDYGADRLSSRRGCRTGIELLERLTGAPAPVLRRRAVLDSRTRASVSLTGQPLPAEFPAVGEALRAGALGVEAAELVTGMLHRVGPRADPADAAAAEVALVDAVTGVAAGNGADDGTADAAADETGTGGADAPADGAGTGSGDNSSRGPGVTFAEVRVQAQVWEAFLDQDGPGPDAQQACRSRSLTLGPARDGLVPVRGQLLPEIAAQLTRLLDAYLNPAVHTTDTTEATATASGSGEHNGEAGAVEATDERTPAQRRHDVLAAILGAAARSEQSPALGGDAAVLLVHVEAADLVDPAGVATVDGIDVPVPVGVAHQAACAGAVQKVVFDSTGRVVGLGSKERAFTKHQRKAITARDGGCVIPGCTIPASWCEVHHVLPWAQDGPTHTDNGCLLCFWHHRHLEESGWQIQMRSGVPWVRAPGWDDPLGVFRPAPSVLTRRSRHRRPGPAGAAGGGIRPGPDSDADQSAVPGLTPNGSAGVCPGTAAGEEAGGRPWERAVGSRRGAGGIESEEEFAARWDATAAPAPGDSEEERRAGWSARNDPPPWDDDEDQSTAGED